MTPNISVVLPLLITRPWQRHITEAAIKCYRENTDIRFELVIVETESTHFDIEAVIGCSADRHISRPRRTTYVKDFNAGVDAAGGDYIVHAGNDVFVPEGWLEGLLEPFERFPDCGISCPAAREPGQNIGPAQPLDMIVEGMYGPLFMFRKGWRLDEAYIGMHSDNDLVMRVCQAGLRSYRNCKVIVRHLGGLTWGVSHETGACQENEETAHRVFNERWGSSPLFMAKVILKGGVVWGREHE